MSQNKTWSLEQINVASPCEVSWESMKGSDRVRHCSLCKKNVYNISEMSRVEAEALIERSLNGERVCAQFYRREDGTILTKDCPVGKRKGVVKKVRRSGMALTFFTLFSSFMAFAKSNPEESHELGGLVEISTTIDNETREQQEEAIRGDIAVVEPKTKSEENKEVGTEVKKPTRMLRGKIMVPPKKSK